MNKAAPEFPFEVKSGSVTVSIYKAEKDGYQSFTVSYYADGRRHRQVFADFAEAHAEAKRLANQLASGEHGAVSLRNHEITSYLRAIEALAPVKIPLDVVAVEYAEAFKRLRGTRVLQAVDYYLKKHPTSLPTKQVAEVVEELIEAREQDDCNPQYVAHLRSDLDQFSKAFSCPIAYVTGKEIDQWLRSLNVKPRTRQNLRTGIQTLFNFAKKRGYLPKDHCEIDNVEIPKIKHVPPAIYTPAELTVLLEYASVHHSDLVPFLAIGAFSGIRHAEILKLNWTDVLWDSGQIQVGRDKAKTGTRRLVPLTDNLKLWLAPFRQEEGPLSRYRNISNEICKLQEGLNTKRRKQGLEGFTWRRNALRHSFASYRIAQTNDVPKTAIESGNSQQIILSNYRELVRPEEAQKWFAIVPTPKERANVIPLRAVA